MKLRHDFKKSLWVYHCNTGSCNGCDIEILAALTPRYDAERFGVKLVGSPRHADVLLVTGPVTSEMKERLLNAYEQAPDPKAVIVVGSCGATGGVFYESYNLTGPPDKLIPVDIYIPACPPRPEAILEGVVKAMAKLEAAVEGKPKEKKQRGKGRKNRKAKEAKPTDHPPDPEIVGPPPKEVKPFEV